MRFPNKKAVEIPLETVRGVYRRVAEKNENVNYAQVSFLWGEKFVVLHRVKKKDRDLLLKLS